MSEVVLEGSNFSILGGRAHGLGFGTRGILKNVAVFLWSWHGDATIGTLVFLKLSDSFRKIRFLSGTSFWGHRPPGVNLAGNTG